MVITLVIAIITFILFIFSIIFFPKIKIGRLKFSTYVLVALLGAILMLITQRVNFNDIFVNIFDNTKSINPVKILCLFFSMSFISIFLEQFGFFKTIASYASKKAKKNQFFLFVIFYLLTSILTIFTSNDIVILTLTPFLCYFCKNAKLNPLPYLISEFAAANTWSMMLIIGNHTNMYLGGIHNLEFISYFKIMVLPTIGAGLIEFIIIYLLFRKDLKKEISISTEIYHLENKVDTYVGLTHLLVCLVFLVFSNFLQIDMWIIPVCVAGSLLIYFVIISLLKNNFKKCVLKMTKSLPWEVIPFVFSMFVIVISLEKNEVVDILRNFLGSQNTIWTYGPSSFLFANLINNIPMSILFSTLPNFDGLECLKSIYSSIIGSNIGAFLTPIGALAGIMFTSLIKKYEVKLSFKKFCFYGIIISIPTLFSALLVLELIL